jgi:hypothetical protein
MVLKEHEATFPDQKGKRIQNPTARWVFHYFIGIHVLYIPGQGLMILNLTDEHQQASITASATFGQSESPDTVTY